MNVTAETMETSWKLQLIEEFKKPYIKDLNAFLQAQTQANKVIYPKAEDLFKAFELTPFEKVKVVLLGQDPYHGVDQAHGLCFSVKPDCKLPPSLVNIYKELENDLNIKPARHGYLKHWATQGVLLLNSVLSVEQGLAASHQKKGWEQFTDAVIKKLNARPQPIVFLLWGNYAQCKGVLIDNKHHYVLKSAHPSPLSASRGFFGNRHFSGINDILIAEGLAPIDWQLPETASDL